MARTQSIAPEDAKAPSRTTSSSSSKLSATTRFFLVTLMSFSISAVSYAVQGTVMDRELSTISRRLEGWEYTAGLLGWRLTELGVSWFGGFDDYDVASIVSLTHTPYLFLIYNFYGISAPTVVSSLLIDILSIAIPTHLLRPRSPTHSSKASTKLVPNRNIIHDGFLIFLTSLLGASVYGSTIFAALRTYLPTFLAVHFDGLKTLESVDRTTLPILVGSFLPLGWALRSFLLDPSLGYEARLTAAEQAKKPFNPETATLGETIRYNLWGYDKRTKVLVKRATLMAAMIVASTTIQTYGRLEGAELTGALGYAAQWAAPEALAMALYEWVGAV